MLKQRRTYSKSIVSTLLGLALFMPLVLADAPNTEISSSPSRSTQQPMPPKMAALRFRTSSPEAHVGALPERRLPAGSENQVGPEKLECHVYSMPPKMAALRFRARSPEAHVGALPERRLPAGNSMPPGWRRSELALADSKAATPVTPAAVPQ